MFASMIKKQMLPLSLRPFLENGDISTFQNRVEVVNKIQKHLSQVNRRSSLKMAL